jgi:hypothetical protein
LLTKEICKNVKIAAASVENIGYTVVLRGDSTLRGHFPEARANVCLSLNLDGNNSDEILSLILKN